MNNGETLVGSWLGEVICQKWRKGGEAEEQPEVDVVYI